MLLLPSTTSHTVGVMGDVLCMPRAQLSLGPPWRGVVVPVPGAAEPAPPPTMKPPLGVDEGRFGPAGVAGVSVVADEDERGPELPPRFAVPELPEVPLQAATKIKLTSSAKSL